MGKFIREQMYTITLTGDVEITTRGFDVVVQDGYTIIPNGRGKPVFMTLTLNIVNIQHQDIPLFL